MLARSMMDSSFAEPLVFVGSATAGEELPFRVSNVSGLSKPLPANVMLITRSLMYDEAEPSFLIRLGHQYGVGEDAELSKSVEVDLATCVPGYEIVGIVETTLSGNQAYSSWLEKKLDWSGISKPGVAGRIRGSRVTLFPMDIRTFKVIVTAKK